MSPSDRISAAIIPTDAVARAAELRWGCGRLESLVSAPTAMSWKTGWQLYRSAITEGDADAVERLAPKIARAIQAMEAEAEAAGHSPLSPTAWEAPLADGRVLVVTRTFAEAHALACPRKAVDGAEAPAATLQAGDTSTPSGDAPDSRERVVWTMEELARVLPQLELLHQVKVSFPGARVQSVVQRSEGFAADWADGTFVGLHEEVG